MSEPFVYEGEVTFCDDRYEPYTVLWNYDAKGLEQVVVPHFVKTGYSLRDRFRITIERL